MILRALWNGQLSILNRQPRCISQGWSVEVRLERVCAATSTWLDKLLNRYGSKYEDQAETLRTPCLR